MTVVIFSSEFYGKREHTNPREEEKFHIHRDNDSPSVIEVPATSSFRCVFPLAIFETRDGTSVILEFVKY